MKIDDIMFAINEEARSLENKKPVARRTPAKKIKLVTSPIESITLKGVAQLVKRALRKYRAVYSIPVLGSLAKLSVSIIRLPKRLEQIFNDAEDARQRLNRLENTISYVETISASILKQMPQIHAAQQEAIQWGKDTRELAIHEQDKFHKKIDVFHTLLRDIQVEVNTIQIQDKKLQHQEYQAKIPNTNLDRFYYDFENRFRGEEKDLIAKLTKYLNVILDNPIALKNSPILDIGSGRGEWLSLLKKNGVKASGIDTNSIMVEESKAKGLDVTLGDAIGFLSTLPENSLGGITGFHVVEHLPFQDLIGLFDQAFRTLQPGGILIFETPNPENLRVGSCNFYTDPTHLNPIPPHTLSFIAENRGFENIIIERSSPTAEKEKIDLADAESLTDWVNKEHDYAIIAHRRSSLAQSTMPFKTLAKAQTIPQDLT